MKTQRRSRVVLLTLLSLCTCAAYQEAAGAQAVKVHKHLISVMPPDEAGIVQVHGEPGAIASDEPVSLHIENVADGQKVIVQAYEDGAFSGGIAADAGQKVRVVARNRQGRSIGTFMVPLWTAQSRQVESKEPPAEQPQPPPADPMGPTRVAVIVVVVDTDTGEVLAAERIAGEARRFPRTPGNLTAYAQSLVRRCLSAVRQELRLVKPSIARPAPPPVPIATENMPTADEPDDPNTPG